MPDQYNKVLDQLIKSMEKPTPEALYHQLGRIRNDMPDWSMLGMPESTRWIGRVIAVVDAAESIMELANLRVHLDQLRRVGPSATLATMIAQEIDTVIAKMELKLPAEAQGAFIPAGGVFDGHQAVSKAMNAARKQILLVDPYADDTLISDFVSLAPETIPVQVLSDAHFAKPSLKPAAERWNAQWQGRRPLEVRLAPARSLHDRLIVTDGSTAWVVGQSFKDLAKRAHTSLVRMDPDSALLKINAFSAVWQTATAVA